MKNELCVKLVIYKDYKEMHGQQNIKYLGTLRRDAKSCGRNTPDFLKVKDSYYSQL